MKILWVKNNLLHPLDSGGKIRTYNMLIRIKQKHEVDYIAYADEDRDRELMKSAEEYCNSLFCLKGPKMPSKYTMSYYNRVISSLASKHPFTVLSYSSKKLKELIDKLVKDNNYDLLVADFLTMCLNIPDDLQISKVHFSHNVESIIWDRHVKYERNKIKKLVFRRERERIKRFEKEIINKYSLTIAVSKNDYDYFSKEYGGTRLGYISTGVDTEYFSLSDSKEEPESILFLGSMDWLPNIDAVHYFVGNIYPFIRKEIPGVKLYIVGRNPVDSIKRLEERSIGITVSGTVPDTRSYIGSASCAVVPIRIGGGTRIKIYEMMSMGKPVISTTIGAQGLDYDNGENILIEDEPQRFSKKVIKVLLDQEFRTAIGRKAREYVVLNCSWDSVAEQFMNLLTQARGC